MEIVLYRGPVDIKLVIPYPGAYADFGKDEILPFKAEGLDNSLISEGTPVQAVRSGES